MGVWVAMVAMAGSEIERSNMFGNDMLLFGNDLFLLGNDMLLFGNDMFLLKMICLCSGSFSNKIKGGAVRVLTKRRK